MFSSLSGCSRDPLPQLPRVMLWAWENPEHLEFIDPRQAGVAFLAKTILATNGRLSIRPRFQPLRVPDGTALMAVVRLETSGERPPAATELAPVIADTGRLAGVRAVQIDFDARESERGFYRDLIGRVRKQLPDSIPLSATALASWCNYDAWMTDLPLAEAVPMLFRMGPERYRPGESFRVNLCRSSIGISTDEPIIRLPRVRRIYVFHPGAWSKRDYENALQEVKRWL